MSIFDKAKQGVDVAKFKADQLLRVNKVQNEAGALRREILGVREKIAEAVVQLHKQGPLTYPDVEDLCLKIDQIEAQIAEKDAQVVAIRAELPPVAAVVATGVTAAAVASPTAPCPQCKAALPVDAAFCSNCGYKTPPRPKCAKCGFMLSGDAAFCPNCGQRVEQAKPIEMAAASTETTPEPPPDPNKCKNCGYHLPSEAVFCPSADNLPPDLARRREHPDAQATFF